MKNRWVWYLLLFDAVIILAAVTMFGLNWHAKRHIEIKRLETHGTSESTCAVVPGFELLRGSDMTLITTFLAQPYSNYVVSYGDGKPDGNLNVTEGGVIALAHDLQPGWNQIYFSYAQAVPECWSVYSIRIWAPYLGYPWETEENPIEEKKPRQLPLPGIEMQTNVSARNEIL
jgi:hypothetical protein